MNVADVGGAATNAELFSRVLAEEIGPFMLQSVSDIVTQGKTALSGVEQAFGSENPAKKAVNMEIA